MKQTLVSQCFISMLLLLMLPLSASALTIDGYEIPQIIPATSQHAELKLNGASMRILYGVVDTYIGKLYVENPETDPDALIEADEFKRMVFKIVMKRISGRRIAKAMYEALQLNVTREEASVLEDRLQLLVTMFDSSLKKGQESYVEWVPSEGSRIVLNGEVKGMIPGKDLYDALLRIWIGENPVGSTFKRQVLGIEEYQAPRSIRRKGRR
ncbi:MAG: chalcone isomerase family protein [Oleispira antarctica]|nr:chalcone isomerase family protein [Oleispira antarctica]MBQ0791638.1 chalcone isomerase family protein [Oleispira antarctica]